ncbi:hypothetical protein B0T24DRAFT_357282 [Lasiosphaeria ovina]|uniref:NAD-dependent epimerase/dehydratase domain-containing protein n=1 Tax=Lasiosphaeria ovina TaxID=92902 RepID=A0AAE0K459_9PEZI|nr:hypothetical protein B0T24DRAFT_357282 [Lasiosphaeria ovina]
MSSTSLTSDIPKGSIVLVTGATGFIGSHTVVELLQKGYKVRGTVRNLEQASWLPALPRIKPYADKGDLELVEVPDLGVPRAFDDAVRGVSAIINVAAITSFDLDPNNVIPADIQGITSILESAMTQPTVRALVHTSSILASTMLMPGLDHDVGPDLFNDLAVQLAWAPPPHGPSQPILVYAAGKVESDKALWKFVDEHKPKFRVNAVLPSAVVGEPLNQKHVDNPAVYVRWVTDEKTDNLNGMPAFYAIDVGDTARLHVAAALDPEVNAKRMHTWGVKGNWNDVLAVLRKLRPQRKFMADMADPKQLSITTDETLYRELLKKWFGQDDWVSLEGMVTNNFKGGYLD